MRSNLLRVLAEVRRGKFDLLVLSGDLIATREHGAAYRWLTAQLATVQVPVLVMAGNHDDKSALVEAFHLQHALVDGQLTAQRRLDGATVYALDSSTHALPESQLAWLHECIARDDQRPVVFMHHPPLACGARFMDRHEPLRDRDDVWRALTRIPGIDTIFCGHYHTHTVIERDGVRVVLCPSTELQISRESEGFAVEHERPGYLEIEVGQGGVSWRVHYLDVSPRVERSVARTTP